MESSNKRNKPNTLLNILESCLALGILGITSNLFTERYRTEIYSISAKTIEEKENVKKYL